MAVSTITRAHLFINGQVQGVSFRFYIQKKAQSLGLSGWAKNLPNGQVEAIFEGPKDKVEAMIKWCQTDSPTAKVSNIEVAWQQPSDIKGFEISL